MRSHGTHCDLYILEPRHGYSGLVLELKAADIYKKNSLELLKNEHVEEQKKMLERLNKKGYAAEFAIGFDAATNIVDSYMNGTYG